MLSEEEAEIQAQDICTDHIRRMEASHDDEPPTALLSSCVHTISELLQKAPEWVATGTRVRNIIESLDMRLVNKDWPGLTALNGKTIEYTQVQTGGENGSLRDASQAPVDVISWLNFSALDVHHAAIGISGDRTHVLINSDVEGEPVSSRVSVGKLLDQYNAPPELRKLMTQLPSKSTMDRIQIEISTDPADVLRKSTGQFWKSCEAEGGAYCQGNFSDVEHKNAVAIIRKNKDIDTHGKWAGRFMLRSCTSDDGQVDVGIERRVYGDTKLEREALKKMEEYLLGLPEHYTAYSYCYTPYDYAGYSDQMGGGGTIVYGDKDGAVESIFEKAIEKVQDEMSYDGVCKRMYPSPREAQYYEGSLADLYEANMRQLLEENVKAYLVSRINELSFQEVTQCRLDINPDAFNRWKARQTIFQTTLDRLKEVFENEVYIVGEKHGFDQYPDMHLFSPACEDAYNRNPYQDLDSTWAGRMDAVSTLLNLLDIIESDDERRYMKLNIVRALNPWNDTDPIVEPLDEARARGPFSSEEMSRYCWDITSTRDSGGVRATGRMAQHGTGFYNVGYTEDGRCPIDSPAIEVMVERCRIREKLGLSVRGGGTEVFTSEDEVGDPNDRPPEAIVERARRNIERTLERERTPINSDLTSEEARAAYRQYLLDNSGAGPPRELFPGTAEELIEREWRAGNLRVRREGNLLAPPERFFRASTPLRRTRR